MTIKNTPVEYTDEQCSAPDAFGGTHHFVPRAEGSYKPTGQPAEPRYVQECRYCLGVARYDAAQQRTVVVLPGRVR